MGYSTSFDGVLKFKNDITIKQLNYLKTFLGEDCREHEDEWDIKLFCSKGDYLSYIDFKVNEDCDGIEWDGSEKSYDMVKKVNLLIHEMRKKYPDFCLTGELIAQGERWDDRWKLVIDENDEAKEVEIIITGTKVTCPHCGEDFVLEDRN